MHQNAAIHHGDLADVGNATLATDRFKLATAATRMSETSTSPERSGAVEGPALAPAPGAILSSIALTCARGRLQVARRSTPLPIPKGTGRSMGHRVTSWWHHPDRMISSR